MKFGIQQFSIDASHFTGLFDGNIFSTGRYWIKHPGHSIYMDSKRIG